MPNDNDYIEYSVRIPILARPGEVADGTLNKLAKKVIHPDYWQYAEIHRITPEKVLTIDE